MKQSETPSAESYIGHVKNGVIVLDVNVALRDGQAVRIEPLGQKTESEPDMTLAERVRQLQQILAEWNAEDGKLSDDVADRLRVALQQNRGLSFRSPTLD